jgi:hypothetical protein
MTTAFLNRRHRAQTNLRIRRPLPPLATLFLLSAALFRLGVLPAVIAAPTTPPPNSQSLGRALGWVHGFDNDEEGRAPVLHPSPEFHIGADAAASTPGGSTNSEIAHKQATGAEYDVSKTNDTNYNTTESITNHTITTTNNTTPNTRPVINPRNLLSTSTQPQVTPAPTHPHSPPPSTTPPATPSPRASLSASPAQAYSGWWGLC